jgi:hypothetical protein
MPLPLRTRGPERPWHCRSSGRRVWTEAHSAWRRSTGRPGGWRTDRGFPDHSAFARGAKYLRCPLQRPLDVLSESSNAMLGGDAASGIWALASKRIKLPLLDLLSASHTGPRLGQKSESCLPASSWIPRQRITAPSRYSSYVGRQVENPRLPSRPHRSRRPFEEPDRATRARD